MISVKRLIDSCDITQCIDDLVDLHRVHYKEPGYLLDGPAMKSRYTEFVENILRKYNSGMVITSSEEIICQYDSEKKLYSLTIGDGYLRDWVSKTNFEQLAMLTVDYPDSLTKEQILLELIYELTYYEFIEIS